jgi:hypothetical protein
MPLHLFLPFILFHISLIVNSRSIGQAKTVKGCGKETYSQISQTHLIIYEYQKLKALEIGFTMRLIVWLSAFLFTSGFPMLSFPCVTDRFHRIFLTPYSRSQLILANR